jgi:hypothetical protein
MNKIVRHALVVGIVGAGAFVLACNNKIAECNKLIEKANSAMTTANNAQKKIDGKDDGKEMGDMAKELDTAKADIQSVQLTDTTLKGFQTQYVSTLDRMSTAAKSMQAAGDKQDVAGMTAGLKDLQSAADDNSKLVDNINKYCTGST